jgi:hypothetical protein
MSAAPFAPLSPMTSLLVEMARTGVPVTLADKIRSVTTIEEINGLQSEVSRRGQRLTTDEMRAIMDRRAELRVSK